MIKDFIADDHVYETFRDEHLSTVRRHFDDKAAPEISQNIHNHGERLARLSARPHTQQDMDNETQATEHRRTQINDRKSIEIRDSMELYEKSTQNMIYGEHGGSREMALFRISAWCMSNDLSPEQENQIQSINDRTKRLHDSRLTYDSQASDPVMITTHEPAQSQERMHTTTQSFNDTSQAYKHGGHIQQQ